MKLCIGLVRVAGPFLRNQDSDGKVKVDMGGDGQEQVGTLDPVASPGIGGASASATNH